jgi:Flp pilus assembly protein TadG
MTRRNLSQARKRAWGGAVLEAAIVLVTLCVLTFGMAEYSYFFFVKHTLEGAAREGARNAITPTASFAGATAAADNAITAAGLNTSQVTIAFKDLTSGATLNASSFSPPAGDPIQVTVTASWSVVGVHPLGNLPGAIPMNKQVIGTCVMRKEG